MNMLDRILAAILKSQYWNGGPEPFQVLRATVGASFDGIAIVALAQVASDQTSASHFLRSLL
jgi:hypothetical protein